MATDRLQFAHWVMTALVPQLERSGRFRPASEITPAGYELEMEGLLLLLTTGFLAHPGKSALSNMLDVWFLNDHRKVLSVSWVPSQPWHPPEFTCFKAGDWMARLGWSDAAGK